MNRDDASHKCSAGGSPARSRITKAAGGDAGATVWAKPLLALLFVLHSLPAAAALQAWLDRDRVALGESVELTLQRDGRSDSQPDLAPLQRDFDILGKASGSSVQIVNGHMNAQVQLRLTLAPKHDGRIAVPPLSWGGEKTSALVLSVAANAAAGKDSDPGAAASSHVFITSSLEQKQPYVQAATPLKLRLYSDQPLYQASLDLAASNDVLVQQIGKDRQGSEMRGGRRYQVIERDYLLFPQRSGRISLAGPVLEAQVADARAGDPFFDRAFGGNPFAGMMNATRPLRLQGDPIVLDTHPRPAAVVGADWLPAQQVSLEESWRPDDGAVHAGEPITRHLRLSALGVSAAQLPDLAARMPLPEGVKAYPDQPRLASEMQDGNLNGSREQDIALIASRPGRYTLPAMRLAWWDTTRNSAREVILPERVLEVLPGVGSAGETVVPPEATPIPPASVVFGPLTTPGGAAFFWPWLSLALGLLWLVTLLAWWRARRGVLSPAPVAAVGNPDATRTGEARKAFRRACRADAAADARRQLLAWARANWPDDPPGGLNALARRLPDPRLPTLLRELDRACYAGGEWRGAALLEALTILPDAVGKAPGKASELAGLYP